jgi:hypothetical protein
MLTLSPAVRIYLKAGATDLRRSIDGLAALVRECYLARSFVIRDGLLPEYFRGERCGKAADSEMGKWSWRVREVIVRAAGALLDGAEVNR